MQINDSNTTLFGIFINEELWSIQKSFAKGKAEITRVSNKLRALKEHKVGYLTNRDRILKNIIESAKSNSIVIELYSFAKTKKASATNIL